MKRFPAVGFGLLALLFGTSLLWAQSSTAFFSGVVEDEQNRLVPGATIALRDAAKGQTRQASTDANGIYTFSQVAPGTYEISVGGIGFSKVVYPAITINADDQRSLRIRLTVAVRADTVTVNGEAPLVRESPAVATSVDRNVIENQPLNGRSFQTLINLSPGVVLTRPRLSTRASFRLTASAPERMSTWSMK